MGTSAQVLATEIERVSSKLPTLFERDDVFYSQIDKRPVEIVSERDMRIPLELRPGGKSGHWTSQGGDLGRGGMPTYDNATINTVELIHRLEWTTRRKWATDSSRKAIVNTFKRDLASGMKQFRRYVEALCMSPGTGVLGTISGVVNDPGVSDTYTLNTDGFGAKLLVFGQDFRIFDATLAVDRNAVPPAGDSTVLRIDYPNKTVLAKETAGVIPTDVIVAQGLTTTPPVSIFGVPYHHSNAALGTWLGFDRALTPEVRSNRVNAANAALALPMPRLAINAIGDRLGINQVSRLVAWCHPCQRQAYEELGFELIQITKRATEEGLDLYFNDNMRIAGAPLKVSYSWDKHRIDFVDYDLWGRAEFHPPGWYTDDNGNKFFVVYGASGGIAASNLAYIVASFNLFHTNPAGASYIDALQVPTGY